MKTVSQICILLIPGILGTFMVFGFWGLGVTVDFLLVVIILMSWSTGPFFLIVEWGLTQQTRGFLKGAESLQSITLSALKTIPKSEAKAVQTTEIPIFPNHSLPLPPSTNQERIGPDSGTTIIDLG